MFRDAVQSVKTDYTAFLQIVPASNPLHSSVIYFGLQFHGSQWYSKFIKTRNVPYKIKGKESAGMDLLKKENVQIVESASDWKDAIRMAVLPLEQDMWNHVIKKKSYQMWKQWDRILCWHLILHCLTPDRSRGF